jgi:zinc transporter, ZIP family
MNNFLNVLALGTVAGLGTGLGGLIAVIRRPGRRMFGLLMGFTAGVMITLSFLDLVNQAWLHGGYVTATIGFGVGAIFMFLIDYITPHIRFGEAETSFFKQTLNPDPDTKRKVDAKLLRTGMLVAIGIAIHNTPEGFAVGAGYMHTPQFGIFIAIAITLHNIPEGIATALPLCKSGIGRWKAFRVALFSGLAEPVGAVIAALTLTSFQALVPGALAFAAGVMVFLTLDELIPMAREHGHQHFTALGIIAGAISVFLLSGIFGV